ncbi:MAG: sugar ABC transporter permease [Anaerolineales bacterium]|nr:sugar ABC transporter permease [Anaerolineales bacterium]
MDRKSFFGFSAPSNIVMFALLIFPLVYAAWLGMHYITFNTINEPVFKGLENFQAILSDPLFWSATRWTLVIILVTVPMHMLLGFVFALGLDQMKGRMRAFYLAAFLIPMIVVPLIGTIVFKQLFDPPGLFAYIYKVFTGDIFVFTPTTMKTLILMHTIWIYSPWAVVLFFAGMQTISLDLVDASSIDGASRLQQIRHVIVPHLRSLIILEAVIGIMDAFRIFDNVFVLTRNNPVFRANTIMTFNFNMAMNVRRLGKANATAIIATIAIMVVLIPFLVFMYREQVEER